MQVNGRVRPSLMLAVKTFLPCALVVIGATQAFAQDTNTAPLFLLINGSGIVSPLTNGELLEVGQTYNLVATPNPGFAFSGWQPAYVFTSTEFVTDTNGNQVPIVSTVVSLLPIYTNQASLDFVMQPVVVLYNIPGVKTVTQSSGWQADFVPIVLNIQPGDSAVILSWTNSSCTLQAAPAPGGVFTNISQAVSPYTNTISQPAQYFRLISN